MLDMKTEVRKDVCDAVMQSPKLGSDTIMTSKCFKEDPLMV